MIALLQIILHFCITSYNYFCIEESTALRNAVDSLHARTPDEERQKRKAIELHERYNKRWHTAQATSVFLFHCIVSLSANNWMYLPGGLLINWICMSYLLNVFRGKPWDYRGEGKVDAATNRIFSRHEFLLVCVQGLLLVTYFVIDWKMGALSQSFISLFR